VAKTSKTNVNVKEKIVISSIDGETSELESTIQRVKHTLLMIAYGIHSIHFGTLWCPLSKRVNSNHRFI